MNTRRKFIIGIIEAIKTGMIKLLFVFFANITTKILPKKKLKPKATPIRPNVFALFSGLEISARIVVAATPIRPNVFALFSGLEMSARIVVAVAAVPPLKPSMSLAKNNKNSGIEAIELDQLKRTVKDNIDIPITDPVIQKRVTGLLPYLSLISPIKGEAVNWANW